MSSSTLCSKSRATYAVRADTRPRSVSRERYAGSGAQRSASTTGKHAAQNLSCTCTQVDHKALSSGRADQLRL